MNNMTYEQAVSRLENIVALLEKGQVDLAESMSLYQEGVSLIQFCEQTLQTFEETMVNVYENGNVTTLSKEEL